ncbi:hypothetical protein [Saccharibacillus alkalitolerans]|uniref:DUF4309 domain-containing protein n=1 Tax=Saccharibacillus alkalitolerans TaxID=2705290 RepID=A0ABX0FCN5_9BACL|nr:hypothetical protein [Saccharibacillus alkalitolerans]NGZ78230.1 hypothetical protein [Saccharibacillus alkalitolerans]
MKKTTFGMIGTGILAFMIGFGYFPASNIMTPASAAPAEQTLTQSQETPTEASEQTYTVFINSVEKDANGTVQMDTDRIGWYTGEAADKLFLEANPDAVEELGGAPDGYYIVNNDLTEVRLPVAPDAEVLMQLYDHTGNYEDMQINWNEAISLDKFDAQYNNPLGLLDLSAFPYHITVKDGVIVKIVQQYLP